MLERYIATRSATESLAAPLSPEDQNLQSMPDASPVKWHRAHATWFFETFVLARNQQYRLFNPDYKRLFNSYYEAVGAPPARSDRGLMSRPDAEEVGAYRRYVDQNIFELLEMQLDEETEALVELGINHEQQHQELILTDILHAFASSPVRPAYCEFGAALMSGRTVAEFDSFGGGLVEIGHQETGGFAFDNESPRHKVFLIPFRLANRLITNGEWLEFIEAGGYSNPEHWLSDGWQFARSHDWHAPLYWEHCDGQWLAMTLAGMQPVDPNEPISHVSFYEADAFARWRGKRLPTEAEWENAAQRHDAATGNFVDSGFLRPIPKISDAQMFGDVWEWTASPYSPYPGYLAPEGAIGEYNGKFMVNQMVLRGGSCVTPRGHVRATYRNFFYPHQRWQFSGLRLAEDERTSHRTCATSSAAVESEFLRDVWEGLSRDQKVLPSKFFYDARGAELFEQICRLPEYYLTRTEYSLLRDLVPDLARFVAPGTTLVEFGSGSSLKTRILLDRLPQLSAYVPIDISGDSMNGAAASLRQEYPHLQVRPVVADFMKPVVLSQDLDRGALLGFFPGSTIGNLDEAEALDFLARARRTLGNGQLLIGIDLVKDCDVLLAAYNDAAGVTAAFNKNLLHRLNKELNASLDVDCFAHSAIWNAQEQRIEMYLVSCREQSAVIGGRLFHFSRGERIHTENCHKYEVDKFAARANRAGWILKQSWISTSPEFAVLLLS